MFHLPLFWDVVELDQLSADGVSIDSLLPKFPLEKAMAGGLNIEYHKKWSGSLNKDMEFRVFGHAGMPAVVFPSGCGRYYEFEDFGMVEAVSWFIDAGKLQLFTIDSVDCEAWMAHWMFPGDRGWRHRDVGGSRCGQNRL